MYLTQTQTMYNVLIVDDSSMNQLFLSSVAKLMGCNICVAQNGKEAVSKSMLVRYDLIFMDFEMPILKGDLATFIIRQNGNPNNNTPIILQTSSIYDESLSNENNGFTEQISKPYVVSQVKNIIKKYTSGEQHILSVA